MSFVFGDAFSGIREFLLEDDVTDMQARRVLEQIYMIAFGTQAALSGVLALILLLLSATTSNTNATLVSTQISQTNNISLIMLFTVMFFLLPSALLIASLWQRSHKEASSKKDAKAAAMASTIAVAVILAISVWLCVFAYFIDVSILMVFILLALSVVLYFIGLMTTGAYARKLTIV